MIFTKEQFVSMGSFYLDDLNINDQDQDFMLEVFNLLPTGYQCQAVSNGLHDSVFRDGVFTYMVYQIYGLIPEAYYKKMEEAATPEGPAIISNELVLLKLKMK
jgi:hypothetical protein